MAKKRILRDYDFDQCGEIQNAKVHNILGNPLSPVESQFWYDKTAHTLKFYNGTKNIDTGLELATDVQAETGTSETVAINPKQLATKINLTEKGANNGVATLGADGKVPAIQLPSYVDDILETYIVSGATALSSGWLSLTSGGSALTPETGKIYVVLSSGIYQNRTFRWGGSVYGEVSPTEIPPIIAGLPDRVTALETRMTTAEGNITTNTNNISSLGTRMTTAEGNITSLGTRMITAEGKITTLENAVSGVETLLHTINSGSN